MAKKSKKYEAEGAEQQAQTEGQANGATEGQPEGQTEAKEAIKRGFHLVLDTPDLHGRTKYRFGKYSLMPKKAPRINVQVDGETVEMAVTNSGGYAVEKGYNGYLTARGHIGWILFGHGVDPQNVEQFPDGLNFTTADGTCDANPVREPASWENENKRRDAAKAAAAKRAEERKAAEAAKAAGEGQPEGQTEAQAQA
jgi:hypothetical protein